MRKIITPILLLLSSIAIAETPKYLIVHSNGQKKPYSINNIRKITFNQQTLNSLEIHQKDNNNVDNYSNLEDATFDIDPTGVEKVLTNCNDLSIIYDQINQDIKITSTKEISMIIVCNANGKIIELTAPYTNEAHISMTNYASGLYIIKALTATNSNTQKIIKY